MLLSGWVWIYPTNQRYPIVEVRHNSVTGHVQADLLWKVLFQDPFGADLAWKEAFTALIKGSESGRRTLESCAERLRKRFP